MTTTRRNFLRSVTAAMAAPALLPGATAASERLPIGFSTLGCPRWEWGTILSHAREWGYAAIELRGIQGEMDLTQCPEFKSAQVAATLRELADADLKISDLGASARLHEVEPRIRAAQLDEAKRFIDLAHRLNSPYIRVFGDRIVPDQPKPATIERIAAGLRELGRYAQGSGVGVLLESHGDFCDSPTLLEILQAADHPRVGLVWDAHHTIVQGKEAPAFTFSKLRAYIHHVHLKDSRPDGNGVRYVLTGDGTIPLREIVQLLRKGQYAGYYSFEWEKAWHPEIAEPAIAIPQFAKVLREYFKADR
jgi:sugar phosphate isomerase/epimerase